MHISLITYIYVTTPQDNIQHNTQNTNLEHIPKVLEVCGEEAVGLVVEVVAQLERIDVQQVHRLGVAGQTGWEEEIVRTA